jgi:hypothetical protein
VGRMYPYRVHRPDFSTLSSGRSTPHVSVLSLPVSPAPSCSRMNTSCRPRCRVRWVSHLRKASYVLGLDDALFRGLTRTSDAIVVWVVIKRPWPQRTRSCRACRPQRLEDIQRGPMRHVTSLLAPSWAPGARPDLVHHERTAASGALGWLVRVVAWSITAPASGGRCSTRSA